jgi:NADH-quinone oxidoreductase subunit N
MNALIVLCGLGIVSLLAEIVNFRRGLTVIIVLGLAAAVLLLFANWGLRLQHYNNMVVFDNFSIAFTSLIAIVSILWFSVAHTYFEEQGYKTDRSALLVFAIIGAFLMVAYNNMAILFLGIEILSICMYVLAGSRKNSFQSNEAAFKYFLMGSFATGFLLFGIALVYGATGSFDLDRIAAFLSGSPALPQFFYAGVLLIFIGMAFKMSAAPFHFWAPDVYEGSPTNITAFMASVVKIASVAAFYKMFAVCFISVNYPSRLVLEVIMVLTLLMGNISAVLQANVKRILAYSSVGHIGFILLGMITDKATSSPIIFYYLSAYAVATITAFAVAARVESEETSLDLRSFKGLFYRNPLLAIVMVVALLSLAGIPPLAGFFAKYLVFTKAIGEGYLYLVAIAIVTSLISVYFYFKVIRAMFEVVDSPKALYCGTSQRLVLIVLMVLNAALGLFPDLVINLLK